MPSEVWLNYGLLIQKGMSPECECEICQTCQAYFAKCQTVYIKFYIGNVECLESLRHQKNSFVHNALVAIIEYYSGTLSFSQVTVIHIPTCFSCPLRFVTSTMFSFSAFHFLFSKQILTRPTKIRPVDTASAPWKGNSNNNICKQRNSQIPKCTCSISHNAPFRTEIYTFLFWMVQYGIYGTGALWDLWDWSISRRWDLFAKCLHPNVPYSWSTYFVCKWWIKWGHEGISEARCLDPQWAWTYSYYWPPERCTSQITTCCSSIFQTHIKRYLEQFLWNCPQVKLF